MRPPARKAPCSGQAMVEMLVMSGGILTLFMGIWYLGKFHDIQASTIQAARYVAWERTVHAPADFNDARLERQTRARMFTWNRDAYKAADSVANGASWGRQNSIWRDHADSALLLARPDDVRVFTRASALPGKGAAFVTEILDKAGSAAGAVTGGEPLPPGGMVHGQVRIKLNNMAALPAGLNRLNLAMSENASLPTEHWDATGPSQAALRTRPYTPGAVLANASSLIGPITWALSLIEPSFATFKPGQICPDAVPADRVSGAKGGNLPVYRGGGPCY